MMLVLVMLLAACGGAPSAAETTVAPAVPPAEPTSAPTVPSSGAAPAGRAALIAEGIARARAFTPILTPAEVTGSYRLIVQPEFGDAQIPLEPQRIVTLDPSLTDVVIALGYGGE
jgi:ABC-type Fe3+-hydroxamate transport system substrate-binding protein